MIFVPDASEVRRGQWACRPDKQRPLVPFSSFHLGVVMIRRIVLVAGLVFAACSNAQAFHFWGGHHGGGCCEPTCCAPEPTCCAPAPSCCAPKCHSHCFGHKFKGLFHKHTCCAPACEPSCCAAEVTCAAPCEPSCAVEPSCCAAVEPSCCAPAPCCGHKKHCFGHKFKGWFHKCCKPACCAPACGCEPSCAAVEPSCCG